MAYSGSVQSEASTQSCTRLGTLWLYCMTQALSTPAASVWSSLGIEMKALAGRRARSAGSMALPSHSVTMSLALSGSSAGSQSPLTMP